MSPVDVVVAAPERTESTWPFWAPSRHESVQAALDLAGVGPGVRVLDLGCGDGQVLLAAGARGALVGGIEYDDELADEARRHLRDAGIDADIRTGDLFDPRLDMRADVLFTYLSPASLQRLLPRIEASGSPILVTVDFDVPGIEADDWTDDARLYRFPSRHYVVDALGWITDGSLVAAPPDCQSLTCLDVAHPAGPTGVSLSPSLRPYATVLSGSDRLDDDGVLATDLRFEEHPTGTSAMGWLRTAGLDDHPVFVVFTDEDDGTWELSDSAVDNLRTAFEADEAPATLAEALAIAED